MPNFDDALYIDRLENDHLARSQLRREPTTDSLEKLVRNTVVFTKSSSPNSKERAVKVPRKNQLPRVPRLSKTLIGIKPQHVKDEEEETRKIFKERSFWIRQQRQLKRNQPSTSSHLRSVSSPSPHFPTAHTFDSISPSGCLPKPITKKQLNLLKDQIHSFKHVFSRDHGDLPSPKSDDWFREEDLSSALDVVLQVEGQNLLADLPLAKKPLALIEKGVDRLGRKLGSLQRRSTCPHTPSLASPAVSSAPQLQPLSPNMAPRSSLSSPLPLTSVNLNSSCSSSSDTSRCKTPLSSPGCSSNSPNLVLTPSPDECRILHNCIIQNKGKSIDVPDMISEKDELASCHPEGIFDLNHLAHHSHLLNPKPAPRLNSHYNSPLASLRPPCPLSIVTKDLGLSDSSSKASRSTASSPSFRPRKSSCQSAPARGPSARHHSQSLVSLLYGEASTDSVCIRGNPSNRRASIHTLGLLPPAIPPVPFTPHRPCRPPSASKRRALSTDIEACHLTKDVSEQVLSHLAIPGTSLETDVLLQQQGGLSFFGQEKFNERFRSKPWQTIKTLRQYDRPGDWDAVYVSGPGCVKLVQTPHSPETYPLPTSEWTWVTDFVVDRHSRPVDADGWEYYDVFTQQWRPFRHGLRTFVRRRRWLRVRAKVNNVSGSVEGGRNSGECASGGAADEGVGPAGSNLPIVILKKLGGQNQSVTIVPSCPPPSRPTVITHRSDSVVAPFELVWDEDGLDCHNPFFCTRAVVSELVKFAGRPEMEAIRKSIGWEADGGGVSGGDVSAEVRAKWLDALAKINLARAAKVLIELSEHQKIKLWRYWLGIDTYENSNGSSESMSRPDPEDLWRVIDRYLDDILDLFVYQHTRFKFLYLVSGVYPDSSLRLKPPSSRPRISTVPDCLNLVSFPIEPSQSQDSGGSPSTTSVVHSGGCFTDLCSGRAHIGYWNDVVKLVSEFEWKMGEAVEWKKKVAVEIRKEMGTVVKGLAKKSRAAAAAAAGGGGSGNHKALTL